MKKKNKNIKVGSKVRDIISGFEGIAIGRAEWVSNTPSLLVAPPLDKDGKFQETRWFDEIMLDVIDAGISEL